MKKPTFILGHHDVSGLCCLGVILVVAIVDVCVSVVTYPFRKTTETPVVINVDNKENRDRIARMPSLASFKPTFWCLGRWSQTVMGGARSPPDPLPYRREVVRMPDGVEVYLDYKEAGSLPDTAPLVLLLHGLGGHSRTHSCQGMAEALARGGGWRVVVYNRRGHGGSSLLPTGAAAPHGQEAAAGYEPGDKPASLRAFPRHADTCDMRHVVQHVCAAYPRAAKAVVGLSAGGNLAVSYQGVWAAESPFRGAVSVSNGHELVQLTTSLMKKEPLGDWLLMTFLRGVLYDRWAEVVALTARAGVAVDWGALLRTRHVRHFEAMLTSRLYGYEHVDDYYRDNSSCHHFKSVRAPLLCISSADDPVIDEGLVRHAQEAARANPRVVSVATRRGGHLGWVQGPRGNASWMHRLVVEYLHTLFD